MAVGFENPKVELYIGDGFEFMKNHVNEFDVIITDSSDPIGKIISRLNAFFKENYHLLLDKLLSSVA